MTSAQWPQNYQVLQPTQTWRFEEVSTWSLLNRCTAEFDTSVKLAGTGSWKITPLATGTTQTRILNLGTPIDVSKEMVCLRAFFPSAQNAGSLQLIMSNAGGSVTNAAVFSWNANSIRHGWNFLIGNFTNRAVAGQPNGYAGTTFGAGAVSSSTIQAIEIDYTGTPTEPWFLDSITTGRKARPAVVFGFDVTMQQGLVDWAIPALSALGTNAYLGISFQNGIREFSYNALNATARAAGWRFVFHSLNHVNYTSLNDGEIVADWTRGMSAMESGGFFDDQPDVYSTFFVPPENGWNASVAAVLDRLGVQYGRALAGARNYPDVYGLDGKKQFQGSIELNNGTSLAAAKGYVDDCIALGYLLHFFGHGLTAGAADALNWNKDDFIALCAYVQQKKMLGLIDTPEWCDWFTGLTQPSLVAA